MGNRDIILIHGFTNKFQDEILPITENTPIHKQKYNNNTKIVEFNKSQGLLIKWHFIFKRFSNIKALIEKV